MPDQQMDVYAASCNPARRAKHAILDDTAQNPSNETNLLSSDSVRPILPKRSAPDGPPQEINTITNASQPTRAKRGRKPGPLSRTARETQRKLNHSIIEKARRTKINDALATLRELVPKDYGYSKDKAVTDYEGEDDEGKQGKAKSKTKGKREEKEKEFKLEILVRTVSYMQDLLVRVEEAEANAGPCSKCVERESCKRKRDDSDGANDNEDDLSRRVTKRLNHSRDVQTPTENPTGQRSSSLESTASRGYLGSRLPSISSWLPTSQIDPVLLSPNQRPMSNNTHQQLPSPPASTHFHPIQTTHAPPALNLGPVATSSLLSPLRTPEDESAASLLLQISASSPQLLPSSMSHLGTSFDLSKMRTACTTPGGPVEHVQAQTPGMMLGLMQHLRG